MKKSEIIEKLSLRPLTIEGGYFSEVYRSNLPYPKEGLPSTFKAEKYTASTSIYYLLGRDDKSKMHAVSSDETWHFYTACDSDIYIKLLVLLEDKTSLIIELGSDIASGQIPQYTIVAGAMMGAKIASKNKNLTEDSWVLVGATVSPSFEYIDFIEGDGSELSKQYPAHSDMILELS